MITTDKLTVRFGSQTLFENVSIKFTPGNCYGIIGANGAGKSTLLKVIAGDIEPTSGEVHITKGQRIAVLRQDHFAFDDYKVIDTVIMGHKKLYDIMQERDALYAKPDFNDEDGIKVAHLEEQFAELDGWQAEAMAASLLSDLGIPDELHYEQMSELAGSEKVRVLLAQALFGNPDILLLDEPTNHLDLNTISWLEEFLINFQNLVIVVSHDRKFLDNVCTHMADIDYKNIQLYTGNYTFWSQASQLIKKQKEEQNKKTEEKMEELKAFIARFSANASKAKQATSRKNMLDKLSLEEIKPSSRQYPRIRFTYNKIPGKDVLHVKNLYKSVDGELLIKNLSFEINQGEKVAFIARDPFIIMQWLAQYSPDQHVNFLRGYLGRMLFSGDDADKKVNVLSGGEKVRCLFAKMMIAEANVMIFDEPTNHLDLEAITALNNAMIDFPGTILFTSQDYQLIQTVADRIIEISPKGYINMRNKYDEYLKNPVVIKKRQEIYGA